VPGSPRNDDPIQENHALRPIHPAALLLACLAVGTGLAMTSSLVALAVFAFLGCFIALHAEGKSFRNEVPVLVLAAIVFAAHTLLSGRPVAEAAHPAGLIALRLLALLYLLRWAARTFLGTAARWLASMPVPRRPAFLLAAAESGRHALALTPRAIREAELQHLALRARGFRPGGGLGGRARYVAAWMLPFLGTMLRTGESYGEALEARGYVLGSPRRSGLSLSWGWPEVLVLCGGALPLALLLRAS
jgi:energy-coupling factor transporter transmembrane protein EcfT